MAMPNAGLDTTQGVEVPPGSGVLRLLVTGVAVGVVLDRHWVVDWVEVTHPERSATRELFSEVEGIEFGPWIVQATELPA
jgi:hypothetical protein